MVSDMYINELENGKKLILTVKIGTETVDFETTVRDPVAKKRAIMADVVRDKDKVVSFNGPTIHVDAYFYPGDSAPLVFRNVKIVVFKDKSENVFYVIASNSPSLVVNRREAFRLYVGQDIVVQKGMNRSANDAILKDISSSGFSIAVDPSVVEYDLFQTIHTVFNDEIEELCQKYSFQLYGIIVRKEETESGKVVYGCKLNQAVRGLEAYITTKERIRLRNKNAR